MARKRASDPKQWVSDGSAEGEEDVWDEEVEWPYGDVQREDVSTCEAEVYYEIEWKTWSRKDGTKTTWETEETLPEPALLSWNARPKNIDGKRTQARRARPPFVALKELDRPTIDALDILVIERTQALPAKVAEAKGRSSSLMEGVFQRRNRGGGSGGGGGGDASNAVAGPSRPRARKSRSTVSKPASSRESSDTAPTIATTTTPSGSVRRSTRSTTNKGKERADDARSRNKTIASTTIANTSSSTSTSKIRGADRQSFAPPPPSQRVSPAVSDFEFHSTRSRRSETLATPAPPGRRRTFFTHPVEDESDDEIVIIENRPVKPLPARARARRPEVVVIDDDDDDPRYAKLEKKWSTPSTAPVRILNDVNNDFPVDDDFVYVERGYRYAESIEELHEDVIKAGACACRLCETTGTCSCRQSGEDKQPFAYSSQGLYLFNIPAGVEVVECNKYCKCESSCRNRVAQKPRDVPIEIFKLKDARGWGVRSPVDIKKGKVVGVYNGLLMELKDAEDLENQDYVFELLGQYAETEHYSVDSRTCGNWTRFLNHSCAPNLVFFLVVIESIAESNRPYIAFVASEDIKARTELTFNYTPRPAQSKRRPPGAKKCRCGTKDCKGWV